MYVWFSLIGILVNQVLTNGATTSSTQGINTPDILVEDYDFENTNVLKVCLIAKIDASLYLRNTLEATPLDIKVPIPKQLTTDGSYCNRNFTSVLQLNFENDHVKMTFRRTYYEDPHETKIATYCRDCYYGQWTLNEISFAIHRDGKTFSGIAKDQAIKNNAPYVLANGVTLRRSFRCHSDDTSMRIPITVQKVLNSTDGHSTHETNWTAEFIFDLMQFQPFLVARPSKIRRYTFSDPVLCRDVTVSHIVVILLPLAYFILLIACYRIKTVYGCPIGSWKKLPPPSEQKTGDTRKFLSSDFSHSEGQHNAIKA